MLAVCFSSRFFPLVELDEMFPVDVLAVDLDPTVLKSRI
jgi:hypothetical protein